MLTEFGLDLFNNHVRWIAVLQDVSNECPNEKRFLTYNSDQLFLDICLSAADCDDKSMLGSVIKKASDYLQDTFMSSKDWADSISEVIINEIWKFSHRFQLTVCCPVEEYPFDEGTSVNLSVSGIDESQIKWESSDESIMSIDDNGRITARKPGIVTITAEIQGRRISRTICVNSRAIDCISLFDSSIVVEEEETVYVSVYTNKEPVIWFDIEDPDILKAEWEDDWHGDTCGLTLTATGWGQTTVTLWAGDEAGNEDRSFARKTISVTCTNGLV